MKCDFCSRGDAQNIDISKEIIDKTLDEVSNFGIYTIRLNGGEPFLNEDMICYILDEIIRRNIAVMDVGIFTNGTIRSKRIKEALYKIGLYCKEYRKTELGKLLDEWNKLYFHRTYNINSYANIIVSTDGHTSTEQDIKKTLDYYNDNENLDILCAYNQSETFINNSGLDSKIVLEGNAIKNFQKFYDQGYRRFNMMNDKYCAIDDRQDIFPYTDKRIIKTMSVSVNGNVYAGCVRSYNNVDNEYKIFNIMDCNNNFYDLIDEYSWENPLLEYQETLRKSYKCELFCKEHNITLHDTYGDSKFLNMGASEDRLYELSDSLLQILDDFKNYVKIVHKELPLFNHFEANIYALYSYCKNLCDNGIEGEKYLTILLNDPDKENRYTLDDINNTMRCYEKLYKERIIETNQFKINPIFKWFLVNFAK